MTGHPGRPLENITISNLQMFMDPEDAPNKRATDAIHVERVHGLKMRNISVKWNEEKPEAKWRTALYLMDVTDPELDNRSGRLGLKGAAAAAIVPGNVADGVVRNLRAAHRGKWSRCGRRT